MHVSAPEFYTIVFGFFAIIIICLMFFIHYLRVGLDSHDSVRIDSKANAHK